MSSAGRLIASCLAGFPACSRAHAYPLTCLSYHIRRRYGHAFRLTLCAYRLTAYRQADRLKALQTQAPTGSRLALMPYRLPACMVYLYPLVHSIRLCSRLAGIACPNRLCHAYRLKRLTAHGSFMPAHMVHCMPSVWCIGSRLAVCMYAGFLLYACVFPAMLTACRLRLCIELCYLFNKPFCVLPGCRSAKRYRRANRKKRRRNRKQKKRRDYFPSLFASRFRGRLSIGNRKGIERRKCSRSVQALRVLTFRSVAFYKTIAYYIRFLRQRLFASFR